MFFVSLSNEKFIRFYITDSNSNGKDVDVVSFDNFDEMKGLSGKIIYRGKFKKEETKQTIDLRVWISDKYNVDHVAGFSYQLNVVVNS